MQNRKWLKIIGILELILLAVMFAIFLLLLVAVIFNRDPRDGASYVIFFLMLAFPLMLTLFAMGFTAYRQHESAVVMQILGLGLWIGIPAIFLI